MKKILIYISASLAVLSGIILMPYAYAQEADEATAILDVESGCDWAGAEGASNLTVADGAVCIISTNGWTAPTVTIDPDVSYGGGTLIIGSTVAATNVTFTVGSGVGTGVDNQGTILIGRSDNPSNNAKLKVNSGYHIDITNNGSLTVVSNTSGTNTLEVGHDLTVADGGVLTNNETVTVTGTTNVFDTGATTNNNYFTSNYIYVGNTVDEGGTFTNNSTYSPNSVSVTTGLYIQQGGTFTNKANSNMYAGTITVGDAAVSPDGHLINEAGTGMIHSGNTTVNNYGQVDTTASGLPEGYGFWISAGGLTVNTGGIFNILSGTTNGKLDITVGNTTVDGGLLYTDAGTTYDTLTSVVVQNTGGIVEINGTASITGTTTLKDNAVFKSGNSSDITFKGEYIIDGANTITEFANIVQAKDKLDAGNSDNIVDPIICIGDYYPAAVCSHNALGTGLTTVTGAFDIYNKSAGGGTITVDIYNNLTERGSINIYSDDASRYATVTQSVDSKITQTLAGWILVQGKNSTFTSNGEIDSDADCYIDVNNQGTMYLYYDGVNEYDIGFIKVRNGTGTDQPSQVIIDNDVTVDLKGSESCIGTGNYCAIQVGAETNAGTAILTNYGLIKITSGWGDTVIGAASGGGGILYIKSDDMVGTGSFLNAATGGLLQVNQTGQLFVERRVDNVEHAEMSLAGPCYINGPGVLSGGDYSPGNMGANINGILTCGTTFEVQSEGSMTIGSIEPGVYGEVIVTDDSGPSTTTVDNYVYMDGLFDTGDGAGDSLTVTSDGYITSGLGGAGDFNGDTDYKIIAHDLTVEASGAISSDGISTKYNGIGSGSYGGMGEERSTGVTYGNLKLTLLSPVLYGYCGTGGNRSCNDADNAGFGGGAVRIYSTGSIHLDGTISANGNDSANTSGGAGAGGTIIIDQSDPYDLTDVFEGTGSITANGGNGTVATVPSGGGGRISIESPVLDDPEDDTVGGEYGFTLSNIQASGGYNTANDPDTYASAGTIVYLGDRNNDYYDSPTVFGTLIVDQNSHAAVSGLVTEIPVTGNDPGNIEFARIEARNNAIITYGTTPANIPTSCFEVAGGQVQTITCNPYADKPDTLFINTSLNGAGTEEEPSHSNPVLVADSTPVFSAIFRNPDENTTYTAGRIEFQIVEDPDYFEDGGPYVWEYSDTILDRNGDPLEVGERSADVEYDGVTPLMTYTDYYIRARFSDTDGSDDGLWTHRDIGDYYYFDVDAFMLISDTCSGAMTVQDENAPRTGNVRDVPGDRYGIADCDLEVSSTYDEWDVQFGRQVLDETFDNGLGADINFINNPTDCEMDTTGADETPPNPQEEFGYNISSADPVISPNVQNDYLSCEEDFDDSGFMFNVENVGDEDTIISVTDDPINEGLFTVYMHVSVNSGTVVSAPYTIAIKSILTPPP